MISLKRRQRHEELIDKYQYSKQKAYKILIDAGYYLPPINSPAVTREYLLILNDIDTIAHQKTVIVPYRWDTFSKEIAFCILEEIAEECGLKLGFDITNMPSKQWMINMAYATHPEHFAFVNRDAIIAAMARPDYPDATVALINMAPTNAVLKAYYKVRLTNAFKRAVKDRLIRLRDRYSRLAINLNSALIT